MPAVWKYTKVIRKVGNQPQNPYDGTLVVESGVRDQYASTPYVDTGLANDTTYFYAAYAYTTQFVVSEGAFASCHLFGFDSILGNNTWEQIDQAGAIGLAPSLWEIGDEKDTTVSGETLTTVILDFNHDSLFDGSGLAPITFGTKNLMAKTIAWSWYHSGLARPYSDSGIPDYLENTVLPGMPQDLQIVLKTVKKTPMGSTGVKLIIPTLIEATGRGTVANGDSGDGGGTKYPYYATTASRIKSLANGSGNTSQWWLASQQKNSSNSVVAIIDKDGTAWFGGGYGYSYGVSFCFFV